MLLGIIVICLLYYPIGVWIFKLGFKEPPRKRALGAIFWGVWIPVMIGWEILLGLWRREVMIVHGQDSK